MIRLGVVMDPIGSIHPHKDSTLAMLLAAQARGCELWYLELSDLSLRGGRACGRRHRLRVQDDPALWYELGAIETGPLAALDVLLMRKDPPFDAEYLYSTYLLELAEADGVLVANRPEAVRAANEKLYTAWFAEFAPDTLVSRHAEDFKAFLAQHGAMVMKPLDGMGGRGIFQVRAGDLNTNVILETLTAHGSRYALAQRYLPEIAAGDKRILLVDGVPVPHALARIPAPGEARGNLAAGGQGVVQPLSARDRDLCAALGPRLAARGLWFVGLDVIGDYLTEINVTSPTGIRELERATGLDIAGRFIDALIARRGERAG